MTVVMERHIFVLRKYKGKGILMSTAYLQMLQEKIYIYTRIYVCCESRFAEKNILIILKLYIYLRRPIKGLKSLTPLLDTIGYLFIACF